MFKKSICLTLIALSMTSCTTFKQYNSNIPFPTNNFSKITILKLESNEPKILGTADIQGDECIIRLKQYPKCLAHEVRHCYEGNWHHGEENDDWCY